MCVREAVRRSTLDPAEIGHCVFGHVIHTEPRDMYLSRVSAVEGGLPTQTPALTLNRLCGSAMQAIISAAQMIALGDVDAAVAGGAREHEPQRPHGSRPALGTADGRRMMIDAMTGALTDPFGHGSHGRHGRDGGAEMEDRREDQDRLPSKVIAARRRPSTRAASAIRSFRCRSEAGKVP